MKVSKKAILIRICIPLLITFYRIPAPAQNGFILLKKKNRTIRYFAKDSHITFRLKDGQWLTGIITDITPDSMQFTQEIIRYYPIGTDTIHYKGLSFALRDIDALPSKKQTIVYDHDQVKVTLGHEKFVWLRNGYIFRVGGAGYTGLNVANDLYNHEPPFEKNKLVGLGIGVAVFMFGQLLNIRFDPFIHMAKRFHLESVVF